MSEPYGIPFDRVTYYTGGEDPARMPSTFSLPRGAVQRLFANHKEVEQEYYRKTRVFPIMHTVVIRGDVYEPNHLLR